MKIDNFISFLKNKTQNLKLPFLLIVIGASLSILYSVYFARTTIVTPYEIGLREGAPQVLTYMLLNGENPYTFANHPLAYNNYSILYNFAVLPFAYLFGNTLHIHRIVSFIFILLSSSLGFWIVFSRRRSLSLAFISSAFLMIAFIGRGGIGSSPTTMGTFFFLAALFIPFLMSFDTKSLIISAFFSLLGLHTKAYNVLAWGIVVTYLFLFVSKKKSLQYALYFLGFFLVTYPIIRLVFPLYLIDMFRGNVSNTFRSLAHLLTQLKWLSIYFSPILLLTLLKLWDERKDASISSFVAGMKFNFAAWDQPLVNKSFNYHLYAFLICLPTFIIVLGSHVGNYLSYAYELVVPTFLFWFFTTYDLKKPITIFASVMIVLNIFYWQYETINPRMLDVRNSYEWEKLFSYIDPSMNILNSPVFTSRAVELGMLPVDSGRTMYFYTMKPYPDNIFFGPSYEEFVKVGQAYADSVNESIREQKYDMIFTTKDVDVFYDLNLVAEKYNMIDQLILYMPATEQKWVVEVWEPIR